MTARTEGGSNLRAMSDPRGDAVAVIPVRGGVLAPGALETVLETAGRTVLIGDGTRDAAVELAGHVEVVELVETGPAGPGTWAAVLEPHLAGATRLILPGSPDGRDLAPRLAARLGWALIAGAIEVAADQVEVVRHGGLVQHTIGPAGPFVATLQPGVRSVPMPDRDEAPEVVELTIGDTNAPDARVIEILPPDAATMDLVEAPRIVGGGAGLMSGDDAEIRLRFETLVELGTAIGATMGATRVVTDAGWVGHERQIGTTGVVVDPDLYLAFGISGAVQHTAGLGHPDHIISVNLDPHCPMMAMADLAVVADANATLDALAVGLGLELGHGDGGPDDDR